VVDLLNKRQYYAETAFATLSMLEMAKEFCNIFHAKDYKSTHNRAAAAIAT
jgi:hypothetical protein